MLHSVNPFLARCTVRASVYWFTFGHLTNTTDTAVERANVKFNDTVVVACVSFVQALPRIF